MALAIKLKRMALYMSCISDSRDEISVWRVSLLGWVVLETVAHEVPSNLARVYLLLSVASGWLETFSQQVRGLGSWIYGLSH
ncbi:unnamed protein product [Brassica rapa]|uniref:Uncharacterized protein n=1 Tax=Brassica campestris TaxID=3711 RepID=A0A3P6BDR6_BRACM|nr:unnamed protein product [Brassica rapa]VDC96030.1 unnamed protein product [Brassica rapa]